ncbi:extracellular solute-binding protein [Cohnella abietis]|uniref:Sugar ABC transporter substrate-binding protein n=1 Tax=Cohnella abietis TaxID=2507935 RepID=A0A3T1DBI4_9BACL|nr:extracellular solute-binding protein [Cohnella abietis]BBI35453.1 hypothetical protein KCTCHS21_48520 [Cohnella abietis]
MIRIKALFAPPLAVILLLTSITVSCSKPVITNELPSESIIKEEPSPYSEHMEISVALWDLAENMTKEDPLIDQLENKLNITIKPITITGANYVQQIQMWASSGQLPDIFSVDAVNSQYYRNWRDRGVIKSLPNDLSAYPYLQQYLSTPEYQDLKDDDQLYFIPRQTYDSTDYNLFDRMVFYRWDLAQKAGITKEPETWEEFRAMLKAIVDQDPENKNITGITSVGNLLLGGLFWLYSSPAATSDGSGNDFKWIKEDGKYIPAVFSKNSIESLKLLRDFYTSGLIDPDLPITRGDMGRDKFAQGEAAALITAGGSFQAIDINIYKERWLKIHPDENAFYDKIKILKPLKSMDGNRYHAIFRTFWSESYISAKVDDKKMNRILQLFDYMNSPEFLEMRRFGMKDVDYTKSNNKITVIDPTDSVLTKYKPFSSLANLLHWDGMFKLSEDFAGISAEAHEAQQEFINYSMSMTSKQEYDNRLTQMSTPTKDGFTLFDSEDMIRVMISKLPVEVIWNDIINSYKAKGLDKMIREVNAKAKEMGIN